jgi:hypothetical protein
MSWISQTSLTWKVCNMPVMKKIGTIPVFRKTKYQRSHFC